jgi:6-phosphogluconolactonase
MVEPHDLTARAASKASAPATTRAGIFLVYDTARAAADAAARELITTAQEATLRRGAFALVLAGGSTPLLLHESLAGRSDAIDWSRTHIYWGDERCVPPEHPDSNFRMAKSTLLEKVGIPEENIHRIRGEANPAAEARRYERELGPLFSRNPAFDAVVLGLGADGHTASLFTGTPHDDDARLVADVCAPEGVSPKRRITLTYRAIRSAHILLFLVTGAKKREVLTKIRSFALEADDFPAVRVASERTLWFLDREAAGELVSGRGNDFHEKCPPE